MAGTDPSLLAEEVATTLRSLVEVRPFDPDSLVARPEFWERCRMIVPAKNMGEPSKRRIFVDGFCGACQWNSLQVYKDALEPGLSLWCGYALYGGAWYNHAWCMLAERIVETTVPFQLYYGAALSIEELECFTDRYGELVPESPKRKCVVAIKDGSRTHVWNDVDAFAETIGRERDWNTGEIVLGLGR